MKRSKTSSRAMRRRRNENLGLTSGESKYAKRVQSGNQMYGWHALCSSEKNQEAAMSRVYRLKEIVREKRAKHGDRWTWAGTAA